MPRKTANQKELESAKRFLGLARKIMMGSESHIDRAYDIGAFPILVAVERLYIVVERLAQPAPSNHGTLDHHGTTPRTVPRP